MALRQLICSNGFRSLGKQYSNLDFVKRQRLTATSVRFIRSKVTQVNKQKPREYSSVTPFEGFVPPNHIRSDVLGKTFLFTVAFTTGTFVAVTIWEYERIRSKAINVIRKANPLSWLRRKQRQNDELLLKTELELELDRIRAEIEKLWNKLSPGEKTFVPILLLNIVVYSLWRLPAMRPTMLKYFASNPAAKAVCWPMFLSTFSHYSLFHLFANMYVLHSFSAAAHGLGREQFLGLYLSAGVISSFASYAFKIATANPGYSLGASGAIMAILAYVCSQYPDTQLHILFVPQFHFNASSAIQAIMCFDTLGLLLRWKMFDHAAHLGGALVGLFWSYYGQQHMWPVREHIVNYWHQLRGKPSR